MCILWHAIDACTCMYTSCECVPLLGKSKPIILIIKSKIDVLQTKMKVSDM